MKNSNAWTFGIIFIGIFIFLALNDFKLPKLFLGDTKIIKGTIIEARLKPGFKGKGFNQNIKFVYSHHDTWFESEFTVDNKYKLQKIGNLIVLEVSESHPDKYKVTGFERRYSPIDSETFIRNEKVGYSELKLENNILVRTRFGLKGKIIKEETGKFEILNDTLKFYPIKIIDSLNATEFIPESMTEQLKQLFIYKKNESLVSLDDTLIVFKNS